MKHTYQYWDRSEGLPGKLLLEVVSSTINDADEVFRQSTGINPVNNRSIYMVTLNFFGNSIDTINNPV